MQNRTVPRSVVKTHQNSQRPDEVGEYKPPSTLRRKTKTTCIPIKQKDGINETGKRIFLLSFRYHGNRGDRIKIKLLGRPHI